MGENQGEGSKTPVLTPDPGMNGIFGKMGVPISHAKSPFIAFLDTLGGFIYFKISAIIDNPLKIIHMETIK